MHEPAVGAKLSQGDLSLEGTPETTVEVETPDTVADARGQLRGHRGPVYVVGTDQEAVGKALDVTDGTTTGVMDNQG